MLAPLSVFIPAGERTGRRTLRHAEDDMKVTRNGQPANIPISLILGLVGAVVGLGSQLWGLAIIGGLFLGYWLLKRYPPRSGAGS